MYGGVDISGSRDFQNAYQLDGISAERQHVGDQRTAYAQDWVQEFQVLTNQFNVEFGQAAGGVLNVVTRSGGSQMTGSLYSFFRDDAWDAMPAFTARKPPLHELSDWRHDGRSGHEEPRILFRRDRAIQQRSSSIVNSTFTSANGTFPSTDERTLSLAKVEMFVDRRNTIRVRYNELRQRTAGSSVGGISTEEHGRFSTCTRRISAGGWNWVVAPPD